MTQRTTEQMTRVLCQREIISYYGGEDSEEEEEKEETASDAVDLESEENESESKIKNNNPETGEVNRLHKFFHANDIPSNISLISPKPIGPAASARTPLELWSVLFSQEILEIILKYTNDEIKRYVEARGKDDCASFQTVTINELKAFIGILYFFCVQNNNQMNLTENWSRYFGSTLCKITMSQKRFEFISCRLRFDDKASRNERVAQDVLAPIREIWEIFIKNCQQNYNPSQFLTIEEQSLGFRGRFSASRVNNKSKQSSYGIKIVSMHDAKTFYMYNAIPYIRKAQAEPDESVLSDYVHKLSKPILNTNRIVTCDNLFASIFDQLWGNYSCARKTRRWPMRFFLDMLDQAGVNGWILYNFMPNNENKREFLKELALTLAKTHLHEVLQAAKTELHKSVTNSKQEILSSNEIVKPMLGSDKLEKRKLCYFCELDKDSKTQYCCVKCKKPVCPDHGLVCCAHCAEHDGTTSK